MLRFSQLLLCLLLVFAANAERVTVSLLATTDLHGNIYPVDYYAAASMPRGLAKIATLIGQARAGNPNSMLIDCGDTIEGTPLEYVYQTYVRTGRLPLGLRFAGAPLAADPMMLAMNALGYDAMVLGNHEFNYGLKSLRKARADARFPWLAANVEVPAGGPDKPFAPYIVKSVAGVKIAVIGLTTPKIPTWEKPENLGGYRFDSPGEVLAKEVAELRSREKPDIVVAAVHAGLDRDLKTGEIRREASWENPVSELAAGVPGLDAIVFGHTHQEVAGARVGGVLLMQPKNWGISLGRIDFALERAPGGRWMLVSKQSRLIPVTRETAADNRIMEIARPYHEMAERYLDAPVAESPADVDSRLGRVEDIALLDAVHIVQLYYAKADVSFASLFNPRVRVPKGPVTVRQIAALYLYDNELYAVEGNGRMVKDALENAARYFISCQGASCLQPPLTNPRVIGYNFDTAEGVEYEIDLTRAEGDRIRNLRWHGRPLLPEQKLRIAVNNYRAGGSGGYTMFTGAKTIWQSSEDIRTLMIQYYTEHRQLPAKADGNWRVIPAEALRTLERQALEDGKRTAEK